MKAYFFISFTPQHWINAPRRHGTVSDCWLCTAVDTHRSLGHACWANSVPWKCVKESGADDPIWGRWLSSLVPGPCSPEGICFEWRALWSLVKSAHLRAYFPSEQSFRVSPTPSQSRRENSVLERHLQSRWGTHAPAASAPRSRASELPAHKPFGDQDCSWPQSVCAGSEGSWCWVPEDSSVGGWQEGCVWSEWPASVLTSAGFTEVTGTQGAAL